MNGRLFFYGIFLPYFVTQIWIYEKGMFDFPCCFITLLFLHNLKSSPVPCWSVELRDAKVWIGSISRSKKPYPFSSLKGTIKPIKPCLIKELENRIQPADIYHRRTGWWILLTSEFLVNKTGCKNGEFHQRTIAVEEVGAWFQFSNRLLCILQPWIRQAQQPYGGDSSIFESMAKKKLPHGRSGWATNGTPGGLP